MADGVAINFLLGMGLKQNIQILTLHLLRLMLFALAIILTGSQLWIMQ